MISDEYLSAIKARAERAQPGGLKADKECTCAYCARIVLLNEVVELRQKLLEKQNESK